jgi:hypothetical protein
VSDTIRDKPQAVLPEDLSSDKHSIAKMDVGATGWAFPWAMYHDFAHKLWLNGSYTIHTQPLGSARMKVWRDPEGWHVDARECRDHKWDLGGNVNLGRYPAIAVTTFVCA